MDKTKLVKILKTFSRLELKKLIRFVKSNYDTNESKVVKLLEEIIRHYPEFKNENFTKQDVFKKIYPKSKYSDETFRKLISYLAAHAEDFLISHGLKKDEFARRIYLLKELASRNCDSVFEQNALITGNELEKYGRNPLYYYNLFRFHHVQNAFHAIRKRSIAVNNYQREADSFFNYFLAEALNIYIYLVNEKKISNREFNLKFFDEVMNHLKNNSYSENISIPVYYNCLMLVISEDEKYFTALRELQKNLDYKTHKDDIAIAYIVLDNFCIGQLKKGINKYRREVFELQKESVSGGLHLSGGRIHVFTFMNMVFQATAVGETAWAESFIRKNRRLLEPEYEFDAVNLSFAKCEFTKKQFEKALIRLGKIDMDVSQFKLSVRTLMLMIYYELDLFDQAASMLDSYRHFLSRDKLLPKEDRQNRIEFAKYFKEIINIKSKMESASNVDFIKNDLQYNNNLLEKEWFLEKLDELGNWQ